MTSLTESSVCVFQILFLIHHRELWLSHRQASTVTIILFAFPFEVKLHYLANKAELAHPSCETPKAKLMFSLLWCSY